MGLEYTRILIVDDNPLLVGVYRYVFNDIDPSNERWKFKIDQANCFVTALSLLDKLVEDSQTMDLVFLDLDLPVSKTSSLYHMEDIGVNIRKRFPGVKIIISADYKNNYQINSVLKYIKPEGFLIATDVPYGVLRPAVIEVLDDPPFYSKSILRSLQKSHSHDIFLDKWDVRMLYELSRGIKMKMLPGILPFSLATIEKRKRQMKLNFGIEDGDDRSLLDKAHEYGFI